MGMANVPELSSLANHQNWQIIDQNLIGADLRLRLIKANKN
jgi:diaminohydroxyphosphoribosylaminopyrimidine deaminase/5-amino-6-(5-phosphoribosylamino)uracil reductase